MKARTRRRTASSRGSNQSPPAKGDGDAAAADVASLMAWVPSRSCRSEPTPPQLFPTSLAPRPASTPAGRVVGRPVVGTEQAHAPALETAGQALQRRLVAIPALPVDQPAGAALERLPDPELARLFSTKCHISAVSTTAARPVGSGLGQRRRAWSLTRRMTLCAETPSRL